MKQMLKPTHTYIGKCKVCGIVLASSYDMVDFPKETGEHVASMVAAGLEVERVLLGSVDIALTPCGCKPSQVEGLPLFTEEVAK